MVNQQTFEEPNVRFPPNPDISVASAFDPLRTFGEQQISARCDYS
jgi:hypothetical protein